MSYIRTVLEFIQNTCSEDPEIEELLKNIDILHRKNIEIEKQLEESEREHVRLQFELYNLDSINSQYDKAAIENSKQTNMNVYTACVDLRNLIPKIDFEKILKCEYLEMEAKCRKECEPIQECMVRTAEWHEKMEQRHVVKRYRETESALKEANIAYKNQQELNKNSLKESLELLNNTTQKRNEIIVNLVQGSKELEKLREEIIQLEQYEDYIEKLKKQKIELEKKLELNQHKTFNFNPIVSYKSQELSKSAQNLETSNITMPKFPSFHDILNSFQLPETKTEITVIENNTCIKSILHNSVELNQSITTKMTKKVHFKMPLEDYPENNNTNSEIETEDSNSESSSQQTIIKANETNKENEEIVEETEDKVEREIIDLLTPSQKKITQLPEEVNSVEAPNFVEPTREETTKENMISFKPKIEIQECLIFKAPSLSVCKEPTKQPSISNDPKPAVVPESPIETSPNSFYEDYSKISSDMSDSASSHSKVKKHSKRSFLKDFDTYFNENKDFLFALESNETKVISNDIIEGRRQRELSTDSDNKENEAQGFIDFGTNDDNMNENFYSSDLDFMLG